MTVSLHARGAFTWREWADALARELAVAAGRGEPDDGTHYYEYWLAALEKLVAGKNLVAGQEMQRRVDEWDAAARATPHGKPIELPRR
jgi:nitrile hydratase accessory protein